jgi:hypothetical protein
MANSQETAGALKDGGEELSDGSIRLFYERTKAELSKESDINADIEDREKYPDFYKFWVEGLLKPCVKALNLPGQYMIPVFDPIALGYDLGIPAEKLQDVTLNSAAIALAAPLPMVFQLLKIQPTDVPDMIPKALALVAKAKPPVIPSLAIPLPNINFEPFGTLHVAVNMNAAVPLTFAGVLKQMTNVDFWASFTLDKIFEMAQNAAMEPVIGSFKMGNPNADVTPPRTAVAAAKALSQHLADSVAFATTSSVIGAGVVVSTMGEVKQYKAKAGEKTPSLYTEAAMNGLVPFEPNPEKDGAAWAFKNAEGRNTFFGDPFVIDYLYELAKHMKEFIKSTGTYPTVPASKKGYNYPFAGMTIPDYTLEVGNITGYEPPHGWRWSKWSTKKNAAGKEVSSHYGSAFDFAYPMLTMNGERASGMDPNADAITGIEPPDDAILKDQGSKSNKELAQSPFRPTPYAALSEKGNFQYDFLLMYEIGRWTAREFIPQMVRDGRIRPIDKSGHVKQFVYKSKNGGGYVICPAICIGPQVYTRYVNWLAAIHPEELTGKIKYRSEEVDKDSNLIKIPFVNQPVHEDHMHFRFIRTRSDPEASSAQGRHCYIIPTDAVGKYAEKDRDVERVKKKMPDGKTIELLV